MSNKQNDIFNEHQEENKCEVLLASWTGTCKNYSREHECTEEQGCGHWSTGKDMGMAVDKLLS